MLDQQKIDEATLKSEKDLVYWQKLQAFLQEQEAGLTDEDRRIREECEGSLATFIQYMWKSIDPAQYKHNWHIDAICEHLENMVSGDIKHLLVNVSPRCMKSILGSVSLTPWIWAQQEINFRSGPQTSLMYASYGQKLSFEHSLKSRTLIMSPLYQKLWGNRFQLLKDQNTITKFSNNKGGYRMATSVGGTLTGTGGSIIGIDDPHNTVDMESEDTIQGVCDWWDTGASTRLNDPVEGSFFVIMQRLRQNDLSGHILDQNGGEWTHLCLPMEYESSRHCITSIGFSDPRTEEGELMWPERIDEKSLKALKRKLGNFGSSGQLQQAPSPKGGGVVSDEFWQPWKEPFFPSMEFILASVDTAFTEDTENDFSACTIWGIYRDQYDTPKIMMMYAWQERLALHDLVIKINATCKKYKVDRLIIENKASGISVAQELRRLFKNELFGVTLVEPKGDKYARLVSVEPLFAEKIIYAPFIPDKETGNLVPRDWVEMVIDQVSQFPKGRFKDLVDTVSQGVSYLRHQGLVIRREDQLADKEAASIFTGAKEALYDC